MWNKESNSSSQTYFVGANSDFKSVAPEDLPCRLSEFTISSLSCGYTATEKRGVSSFLFFFEVVQGYAATRKITRRYGAMVLSCPLTPLEILALC
jgi:hypothetical protein